MIDFHVHCLDEPDCLERFLETHLRLGIDKMCLSLTAGERTGYFSDNAVSLLIRENAG